jgi:hypothetical protein
MPVAVVRASNWRLTYMLTIDQRWTTRLWYKRFTHAVDIVCDEHMPTDPIKWCRKYLKGRSRTYSDYQRMGTWPKWVRARKAVRIYVTSSDYQTVLDTWGDRVRMVSMPFNDIAEAELLGGMIINLRDKLYWNRYRYAINFYCKGGVKAGLVEWVQDCLPTDKRAVRLGRGTHFPILYLREESDMVLVRMVEPAKIIQITRAYTHSEVAANMP